MKVLVQLKGTSQPIEHKAKNTYQKGDFYCIHEGNDAIKYPIANIWRVIEDYGFLKSPPHK